MTMRFTALFFKEHLFETSIVGALFIILFKFMGMY